MPTGYTVDIHDGKSVSFEQFVWQCARAMMPLVTMRDEPHSAQVPERFELPLEVSRNKEPTSPDAGAGAIEPTAPTPGAERTEGERT